jgi:hypothetical protein
LYVELIFQVFDSAVVVVVVVVPLNVGGAFTLMNAVK